ncbi:MAG: DUF2339 domain-containing protein [Vicinamibacterales bacterium]
MIGIILLVSGLVFLVTVVLPIVSFVRVQQANRLAKDASERLTALEAEVRRLASELRTPGAPDPAAFAPPAAASKPVAAGEVISQPKAAAAASPPKGAAEGLEQQIGSRWLLYVGLAAVVLGISYFVKFAFDNGWVSEELRLVAAVVTGLALIVAGTRFSARRLALFGQALSGAGIVVLYVAIYAALHFYGLLPRAPAFLLMALVTAGAAVLAHGEKSQSLAILAMLGGFATPLLVGGDQHQQLVLFTYVGILILGSIALVRLYSWPALSIVTYGCTFVLVLLWLLDSHEPATWLRTELFLAVYLAMFVYLLWRTRLASTPGEPARFAQAALLTAPLTFHVASLYLLGSHDAALLAYFLASTVAGLISAAVTRNAWIRIATLLLVGMPMLMWMSALDQARWYTPAILTACVIYGLHLASQWHALSEESADTLPVSEAMHAQLNGLLLPLTLYVFLNTKFTWWNPRMAAMLAILNATVAWGMRSRLPALRRQYVALAATMAAVAIALAFDGPVVALGWAIEGAVLGWIALNERSRLFAVASGVMICLGSIQIAIVLQDPLPARSLPLFNPRALTVIIVIAVFAWLSSRMKADTAPEVSGRLRHVIVILANLLAIGLLSADIDAYFMQNALEANPGEVRSRTRDAGLMQQVALSITWAAYAVGLIATGIRRHYAPARYLGMLLFALTVAKVVTRDIAQLDRLYRMLSVLVVGILLVLASYLYQRMGRENAEAKATR